MVRPDPIAQTEKRESAAILNAMTIDVEDYYHVSAFESVIGQERWDRYESRVDRNTDRILDLLDQHGVKATFFVLGWVAERERKLVWNIHERGHEVASHGYSHQRIYTQTPDQFREETRRSKQILEDIVGRSVIGYRAASYSITKESLWALRILAEEGFKYDSSIYPIWHDLYGIPDHQRSAHLMGGGDIPPIAEFPLSTVRLGRLNFPVAGGGYLRLFPYLLTHMAIRHINQRDKVPVVVYFHPWEIDPEQPRIRANSMSRLRHYTNQSRMEAKLRKLLSHFSFAPMREVYADLLSNPLLQVTKVLVP